MEVIKYALIPMIWGVSTIGIVLCLLSLIIKKLLHKENRKTKKKLIVFLACFLVTFAIMFTYLPEAEDVENSIETTATVEPTKITEQSTKVTEPCLQGDSKENPFVMSADELADEINADIDAAKEKYNGKWIKITGIITDTSDGGIMYGYYLYGQRSTTGYTGLRIMCWCEDGPYSGSVLGDTQTFLGQVLEITTVNVTEIIDCERLTE